MFLAELPRPVGTRRAAEAERKALRAANELVLDLLTIVRRDHDLVDTILLTTIVQANVEQIARSPQSQLNYGALNQTPPDEVRRPVSVYALASSLGLPPETVRRRVKRLGDLGWCEVREGGVIVPARALGAPEHEAELLRVYGRVVAFDRAVGSLLGFPSRLEPRSAFGSAPLVRAVARTASTFAMRVIGALGNSRLGLIDGLVRLSLSSATAGAHAGAHPASQLAPRAPARPRAVADRLGFRYEFTRRRLLDVAARGYAVRTPDGFLPADAHPETSQFTALERQVLIWMRGMLTRLHRLEAADAGKP